MATPVHTRHGCLLHGKGQVTAGCSGTGAAQGGQDPGLWHPSCRLPQLWASSVVPWAPVHLLAACSCGGGRDVAGRPVGDGGDLALLHALLQG